MNKSYFMTIRDLFRFYSLIKNDFSSIKPKSKSRFSKRKFALISRITQTEMTSGQC